MKCLASTDHTYSWGEGTTTAVCLAVLTLFWFPLLHAQQTGTSQQNYLVENMQADATLQKQVNAERMNDEIRNAAGKTGARSISCATQRLISTWTLTMLTTSTNQLDA